MGGGEFIVIDILFLLGYLYDRYLIIFLDSQFPMILRSILRCAKIVVMPTKCYETFGLTIAESALSGTIPLVSGIGAYKDTAREFCGICFDLHDGVMDLIAKMSEILGDYSRFWQEFESKRSIIIQDLLAQNYLSNLIGVYIDS